jgi:hypothetical protein
MPQIHVSDQLLERLTRLAEHDYRGITLEQALQRLLSEHQEYVVLEAAGDLTRNRSDTPLER